MGRNKRYENEAERQKAYRKRANLTAVPVLAEPHPCNNSNEDLLTGGSGEARESTQGNNSGSAPRARTDSRGGSRKPSHIPQKEWEYALERAQRATDYAAMFPLHVRPLELKYQDPLWQWEHHVKERSSPNQTR